MACATAPRPGALLARTVTSTCGARRWEWRGPRGDARHGGGRSATRCGLTRRRLWAAGRAARCRSTPCASGARVRGTSPRDRVLQQGAGVLCVADLTVVGGLWVAAVAALAGATTGCRRTPAATVTACHHAATGRGQEASLCPRPPAADPMTRRPWRQVSRMAPTQLAAAIQGEAEPAAPAVDATHLLCHAQPWPAAAKVGHEEATSLP